MSGDGELDCDGLPSWDSDAVKPGQLTFGGRQRVVQPGDVNLDNLQIKEIQSASSCPSGQTARPNTVIPPARVNFNHQQGSWLRGEMISMWATKQRESLTKLKHTVTTCGTNQGGCSVCHNFQLPMGLSHVQPETC